MPRSPVPGSAEDWLARARGRLALARQPLPEGGFWEDLCGFAQQCVELSLKAVYRRNNWVFDFVHDIGHLLAGLERQGLAIPKAIGRAEVLSPYASEMRYPHSGPPIQESDFVEALAMAETVMAWAEHIVTEEKDDPKHNT